MALSGDIQVNLALSITIIVDLGRGVSKVQRVASHLEHPQWESSEFLELYT